MPMYRTRRVEVAFATRRRTPSASPCLHGGAAHPAERRRSRTARARRKADSLRAVFFTVSAARAASSVGGNRIDSFADVDGRSVLPADVTGGAPDSPVTLSVGRHVLFSTSSTRVLRHRRHARLPRIPLVMTSPSDSTTACASARVCASIGTCSASIMRPVAASSMRSSRPRRIAKARRHDAARGARVHAFGQHRHLERAEQQAAQRRRQPQMLVVAAFGVETDDEIRRADARCKVVEIRRAGRSCRSLRSLRSAARSAAAAYPSRCSAAIAVRLANIA